MRRGTIKQSFTFLCGGILALAVAMGVSRFAYTPLLPFMQKDIGFSNSVAGYLATSNYAGYLLGAMLAGVLPIKSSRVTFLRISLIVCILTTAGMGLFYSYPFWYLFRFVSGVASAFVFVVTSSIVLDRLMYTHKTKWSGLFYSGVGLGIVISSLLIPVVNEKYGWEGSWVWLAFISAILGVFIWTWLTDDRISVRQTSTNSINSDYSQIPDKWVIRLIIVYGLEGLGYIVTGTFIVAIAENIPGFNAHISFVWLVVGIAAIPSCILWSFLAGEIGYIKALIFAMVLQSIGIILPVFLMNKLGIIISALLFGATFMGITTLATSLGKQIRPAQSNKMIGYLTSMYAIGQMLGPSIAGILMTLTNEYKSALIGAAIVVCLGAVLLFTGIKYERYLSMNQLKS